MPFPIIYCCFNSLTKRLLQFDIDYEEFKQSIDGLKQQLQMFVDSWFEKPLSVSFKVSPHSSCFACSMHQSLCRASNGSSYGSVSMLRPHMPLRH